MEFLLIGDSKLKIVMTEEDMKTFKLDRGEDYSSSGYRRAFWRVLDLAKAEVGFDPEGDKILIQFYPLKSGGCEVFVTKLGILSKESAKMVIRSDKVAMLSKAKRLYAFDSREDLLGFVSAIKSLNLQEYPDADVYKTHSAGYYLAIEEFSRDDSAEMPQLLEYARPLNSDIEFFASEHLERISCSDGLDGIENLI